MKKINWKEIYKEKRNEKQERVVNTLKEHQEGLTIADLASQLKLTRNTISINLAELRGAGKIRIREVGKAKLHYFLDCGATPT